MATGLHGIIMFNPLEHCGDPLWACGADLDPKDPKKTIQWSLFPKKRLDVKKLKLGLYNDDPLAQEILKKLGLPPTYYGNLPGVWPYFIFPIDAFEIGDEECDEGILIWTDPEEIAIFTLVFMLFFDFSDVVHSLFFSYYLLDDSGNYITNAGLFFIEHLQNYNYDIKNNYAKNLIKNKTSVDILFYTEIKTHSEEIDIFIKEYNSVNFKIYCDIE